MPIMLATNLMTQFDNMTATIGDAMAFLGIGLVVVALAIIIYIIMKARSS